MSCYYSNYFLETTSYTIVYCYSNYRTVYLLTGILVAVHVPSLVHTCAYLYARRDAIRFAVN